MFSFPTHFFVGAAASSLLGFAAMWGALGGMLPDLDFFTPWHRGPFHSLVFAVVVAVAAFALTRSRNKSLGLGVGFAAHSVADLMNFGGVMILWPFSSDYLSLNLFEWYDPVSNLTLSVLSILIIILVKQHREKKTLKGILHELGEKINFYIYKTKVK